jgi:hypothetical protein
MLAGRNSVSSTRTVAPAATATVSALAQSDFPNAKAW